VFGVHPSRRRVIASAELYAAASEGERPFRRLSYIDIRFKLGPSATSQFMTYRSLLVDDLPYVHVCVQLQTIQSSDHLFDNKLYRKSLKEPLDPPITFHQLICVLHRLGVTSDSGPLLFLLHSLDFLFDSPYKEVR
jgi:hypothetical protein